jgi:hypothetical protein
MAVDWQIAARQVWKPHSCFEGKFRKFSTGEASMSGGGSNSKLRQQRQLDTMPGRDRLDVGIGWYTAMLEKVAALSQSEFDEFLAWDGSRSPGTATSAWPGFEAIGKRPSLRAASCGRNILEALDRPIAFQRVFVPIAGSINAALLLSQAVYWMKETNDAGGWFSKSSSEWEDETGLTRREQDHARKLLRNAGLLLERKSGMPPKLYYWVDIEKLEKRVETLRTALGPETR